MELSQEMSKDGHMIKIVFGNVQGGPYDRFQKITHILIPQKHSSLEFKNQLGYFEKKFILENWLRYQFVCNI